MEVWKCSKCGYIYDQRFGDVKSEIAKGTAFEDLPESWTCPRCRATKDRFEKVEID